MLNLEPIRQLLADRRYGSWAIPQPKGEGEIGYRYCDPTPSDSQVLDAMADLIREVERLRAENEELRNE